MGHYRAADHLMLWRGIDDAVARQELRDRPAASVAVPASSAVPLRNRPRPARPAAPSTVARIRVPELA